jgi:hypothetical protein
MIKPSTGASAFKRPARVRLGLGAFMLALACQACAQGAPGEGRYIVRGGDSLWRISSVELNSSSAWRDLWRLNRGVKNPDLIFPGDVLTIPDWLRAVEASDGLHDASTVGGGPASVSPADVTAPPLVSPKPVGMLSRPFFANSEIAGAGDLLMLPRVEGFESGRLLGRVGDTVRLSRSTNVGTRVRFYRAEKGLVDPSSRREIGSELRYLGEGVVIEQAGGSQSNIATVDTVKLELAQDDVVLDQTWRAGEKGLLFRASADVVVRKFDKDGRSMESHSCIDGGPTRRAKLDVPEVLLVSLGSAVALDSLAEASASEVVAPGPAVRQPFKLLRTTAGFAYVLAPRGAPCLDVGGSIYSHQVAQ